MRNVRVAIGIDSMPASVIIASQLAAVDRLPRAGGSAWSPWRASEGPTPHAGQTSSKQPLRKRPVRAPDICPWTETPWRSSTKRLDRMLALSAPGPSSSRCDRLLRQIYLMAAGTNEGPATGSPGCVVYCRTTSVGGEARRFTQVHRAGILPARRSGRPPVGCSGAALRDRAPSRDPTGYYGEGIWVPGQRQRSAILLPHSGVIPRVTVTQFDQLG